MEETKKTNEATEKHLSENDAEDAKAFKIDGPKCLMEEDFREIVDYEKIHKKTHSFRDGTNCEDKIWN